MKNSIEQVKKFIVDFESRNRIEDKRFDGELTDKDWDKLLTADNWIMQFNGDAMVEYDDNDSCYYVPDHPYLVYRDGGYINSYAEGNTEIHPKKGMWVYQFTFQDPETLEYPGISYLIFEQNDGNLVFGQFVGD